jgi:ribose-phosphate pyrophosphokinase
LFDVHSDVATALIKRSKNHNNSLLVKAYDKTDAVLIVPDAGAAKKVSKYLEWNPNIKDVVNCVKERDLATGKITLKVLEPSKCFAQNCVIIDDICDGGATFNAIAEALKTALHTTLPASQSLTLIVSHGLFSKGFTELKKNFSQIITSDSIKGYYETDLVKVVPIFAKL